MSDFRLFCIGFCVWSALFSFSKDIGWLTDFALADYWTAKLFSGIFGGAFVVAILGRKPSPTLSADIAGAPPVPCEGD